MKTKAIYTTLITILVLMFLLLTLLNVFVGQKHAAGTAEPVMTADPVIQAEPALASDPGTQNEIAVSSETKTEPGRKNGERFESVIILEGMEETVKYEHIRNDTIGIEMDYDYESFVRRSEANCEYFISVWDNASNPENYFEVTYRAEDADTVAASVNKELSNEYDISSGERVLDRAGKCTWIEASVIKGTNRMADKLQTVYIIPAADGSRVATAHYSIESAEGFGRRFSYMVQTLTVIGRNSESALSDDQALSAVMKYGYLRNPDLENMVNSGEYPIYWDISSSDEREIVVLFRSYTGAQNRYYIDRASGDTYVTEFVPGITPEEARTGESFNVKEYL